MTTSRISSVSIAAIVCLGAAAVGATASAAEGSDGAVPTFKEFESSTYVDVDGSYVVNGDEVEATKAGLRKFYDGMVGPTRTPEDGLIVNTVNGRDDRWSASQALNLTYCVSTKFGARYPDVVSAMAGGAGLWEAASGGVDFIHVPAHDTDCSTRNNGVLFSVEPVRTTQYIARAFFPSTPKRSRNVLIDDSIWSAGSWEPVDILGHERAARGPVGDSGPLAVQP